MRLSSGYIILLCITAYMLWVGNGSVWAQRNAGSRLANALRAVPDSTVRKMQHERAFEYANDPQYWQHEQLQMEVPDEEKSAALLRRFLFILLIIGIAVLLVWLIVKRAFLFQYGKLKKPVYTKTGTAEEDYHNLEEKIRTAIGASDYRQAVRFLYLNMLYQLGAKDQMTLSPSKTDADYRRELAQTAFGQEFSYLSRVYEYSWYGGFLLNENQFQKIHQRFIQFNTTH